MGGKCPACGKPVLSLHGGTTDVSFPGGKFKTIVFQCPMCTAILGAQIDPIALRTDIINETVERLLKALKQ